MADVFEDRRFPRRRRAERSGSTAAPPVFFDPSGKRWYRVLATLVVLFAAAAGAVAWILPQALAQSRERPLNQDPGYPRELLATGDVENIPLLGDMSNSFTWIGLVEQVDGRTDLRDPFSGEVFRTLIEEEKALVDGSPYVVERYRCSV